MDYYWLHTPVSVCELETEAGNGTSPAFVDMIRNSVDMIRNSRIDDESGRPKPRCCRASFCKA